MIDPIGTLETGLIVWASKDLIGKLLGKTADYLGDELENCVKKCNINLNNVFKHAIKKLGNRIEKPGDVSSRVFRHIIDEGRFCEDELMAEYFGGVLASSRTDSGRDDRGAYYAQLLSQMSTYQLRTHYILYHYCKRALNNTKYHFGTEREKFLIFIPHRFFIPSMEFGKNEDANILMEHSLSGLAHKGIIEKPSWGKEILQKQYPDFGINEDGITFFPSFTGIELFLWAHGKPNLKVEDFFKTENQFDSNNNINLLF